MRVFFIIIAISLELVLWVATLLGAHIWIFDLVSQGALYILILLLIHIVILCAYRSWQWAAVLFVAAAAYAWLFIFPIALVSNHLNTIPANPDIFFMNTLYFNDQTKPIIGAVKKLDPKTVAVVEPNPKIIEQLTSKYGQALAYHDDGGLSCAIFSHAVPKVSFVAMAGYPVCVAEFSDYALVVAHPAPPYTPALWREQQRYFDLLVRRIDLYQEEDIPVVLVGDFNSSWFSATLRNSFGAYKVRSFLSWHGGSSLALAIDHMMGIGTVPLKTFMLPQMTSDHRAIVGFFAK